MRYCLSLFLLLTASMTVIEPASAEVFDVWFGTNTPRKGPSKGIYHATFDAEKGTLSEAELAFEVSSPGFLAMHPSGKVLYSTGNMNGEASAIAYKIETSGNTKTLSLLGSQPIGDGGAAHITTDSEGKVLLTAQYGGGSTALFSLAEDGSITKRVQIAEHGEGSGVVGNRQDKPHAHWCGTSPDDRFAFVPDLGMDKVVIWKLDRNQPSIKPHGFGVCPPGGGPRHMKFHPNGKLIFVLNELSLAVTSFIYDAEAGTMTAVETVPTVPQEQKARETFNSSSEIRVHPNGKFVYAANRGNDTITCLSVDAASGKMKLVQREPVRGSWPRNFNIDPTGKWLIAGGRDSHTATVFAIDQESGRMTYQAHSSVMVPSPICVLFGK